MTELPDDDGVPFERRLQEARDALDEASSAGSTHGEEGTGREEQPGLRGEGESADGRVRAVAVTGGRIASLELDPRVMRQAPDELARTIAEALNAALDSLRARAAAERPEEALLDAALMMERLREVQNEGLRQLSIMSRGINDALAGIQDRAHVGGEAAFPGLEHLLAQARDVTERALDPDPGGEQDAAGGTGSAADGLVRVTATATGRASRKSTSNRTRSGARLTSWPHM
ncbi:YbaB/EbfC family nucleoid-associated protein [Actinomadura rugatobispora]|uniref:YbaB/EbfC family nucleoid-associated protein n=1 Tax=Actinomadura rugatobispora TaxID=1994 RepID=A0ABW0ZRV5_9ACTN|nr:hypothetical protein GCM10010200_050470 [Actinomadura rugatobispora]